MSDRPTAQELEAARRHIAHEMRNAIGAIRNAAELLQRRYNPEGRELRLFELILKEVDRLDELSGRPPTPD
jgi:nitrogen-specific signal transduction histidine kinase